MIVPMEKVTLLLPPGESRTALEALRELGLMHIEPQRVAPGADHLEALAEEKELNSLQERLRELNLPAAAAAGGEFELGEIPATAAAAFADAEAAAADLQRLEYVIADLRPWGEFDPALLKSCAARGIYLGLCSGGPRERQTMIEAGLTCVPLVEYGVKPGASKLWVVASDQPFDKSKLPLVAPPERPLSAYQAEAAVARARLERAEATLARLKAAIPKLEEQLMLKQQKVEFIAAGESMLRCGSIAGISGFVPAESLEAVKALVRQHGWGLIHAPADPADAAVPTLLKKPRWVKLLDPLMNFLSLSPGYNEADVSIPVLVFLTIFFGILIADVAYGALFLVIALSVLLTKGRSNPAVRLPAGLFLLFSLSGLFWGFLTGNYGGYEWHGLPYLSEGPEKDNHLKLVCFAIGVLHLSVGHLMRIFRVRTFRNTIAQIGWIMVLVGNFMVVCFLLSLIPGPLPKWVVWNYAIALVLLFAGEIELHDISTLLSCPLEVLSSFSDILSYIRLFAVCLAGFYLAKVFNEIAFGMMHSVAGCIMGVILLLIGHLMNIALGGLAILVHGVRLNALEFSAHSLVRWSGFPFAPFRRKNADKV